MVVPYLVAPINGDPFSVGISEHGLVDDMKDAINDMKSISVSSQKLLYDDVELVNGTLVSDYDISDTGCITLVIRESGEINTSEQATACPDEVAPPVQTQQAGVAEPTTDIIQPHELSQTVVITNIMTADQDANTELAIVELFSSIGTISRLIMQTDNQNAQHAVVVFDSDHTARQAVRLNGELLFGSPVSVVLAAGLDAQPSGGGGDGYAAPFEVPTAGVAYDDDAAAPAPAAAAAASAAAAAAPEEGGSAPEGVRGRRASYSDKALEVLTGVLAQGYVTTRKGLQTAKRYDEKHQMSMQVGKGVDAACRRASEVDKSLHVSEKLGKAYTSAKTTADRIDEKYHVTANVTGAVASAVATTQHVSEKAMENPHVASGVSVLRRAARGISRQLRRVADTTSRKIDEKEGMHRAQEQGEENVSETMFGFENDGETPVAAEGSDMTGRQPAAGAAAAAAAAGEKVGSTADDSETAGVYSGGEDDTTLRNVQSL